MPLTIPTAPAAVHAAVQRGLQQLASRRKDAVWVGAVESGVYPVFILNKDDVLQMKSLNASRLAGWRYILEPAASTQPSGVVKAAAEVTQVGGAFRFSHLQHGWLGDAMTRAISAAADAPAVANGTYEPRALRIPSLYVEALWLKDQAADDDLVMAIASPLSDILRVELYSVNEFLSRLRTLAEARPRFDDRPQS